MIEEIESYYRIRFKDVNGHTVLAVVKTPYDMSMSEIEEKMMTNDEVSEIKSVVYSDYRNYSYDLTIDSNK